MALEYLSKVSFLIPQPFHTLSHIYNCLRLVISIDCLKTRKSKAMYLNRKWIDGISVNTSCSVVIRIKSLTMVVETRYWDNTLKKVVI